MTKYIIAGVHNFFNERNIMIYLKKKLFISGSFVFVYALAAFILAFLYIASTSGGVPPIKEDVLFIG